MPENFQLNNTPYADWLIDFYNIWDKDIERPKVRMFNGFIECMFGEEYPTDLFGNYKNGLLVIETNGDIEAVDYLKACGDNFTKTKLKMLNLVVSYFLSSL